MCSPNLRSVSLSSHSNCRSCQCKPILSVRRLKMMVWGSFPPFLSSLRTRGVRMPFFLFSLRRRTWSPFSTKNFFCSSCAGEFSRHFVCGKSLHGTGFFCVFFSRKKIFRNFFWGFFLLKLENQVQKFPGSTKIADFRKNAEDWKHWKILKRVTRWWEEILTIIQTHLCGCK